MVNKKQLKQKNSKKRKTVIRKHNKKNGKKITKKQLKGGENKKYSCVCEKAGTVLNSKKVKCECEVKPDNTSSQTKPLTILPETHYNTLELPRYATSEQIKKNYRKKAKIYHPDRNIDKSEKEKKRHEEMFYKISKAYETLSDPDQKNAYNRTLP